MKILFHGDSITDCSRNREDDNMLGTGYPQIVYATLGSEYPGKFTFLNRGISGNRIVDLYANIRMQMVNLNPDVLSLLIGVNDVWHELDSHNGVEADRFERLYDAMLDYICEKLPDVKLLILEPFLCPGTATNAKWEEFRSEVELRAQAARRVAERHSKNAVFVELQKPFDEACARTAPEHWTSDGVHPTPAGHMLITNCWLNAFHKFNIV